MGTERVPGLYSLTIMIPFYWFYSLFLQPQKIVQEKTEEQQVRTIEERCQMFDQPSLRQGLCVHPREFFCSSVPPFGNVGPTWDVLLLTLEN